jgi:hypothetical protein
VLWAFPAAHAFIPIKGKTIRVFWVKAGDEMFPPTLPVGERVSNRSRDGTHETIALDNYAVFLLQDNAVAVIFEDFFFKGREQTALYPDTEIVDAEIHAKIIDSIVLLIGKEHLFRQSLFMPDRDGLLPKAEIGDGGAIARLVVHGGGKAQAVVHEMIIFLRLPDG